MALYKFNPSSGPFAGTDYYLPYSINEWTASTDLNVGGNIESTIVGGQGTWLGTGTGPMLLASGTASVTFVIGPAFLRLWSTYYTLNIDGVEKARKDFARYVLQGGLGLLTDRWWTGTAWNTKTCTAIVSAAGEWTTSPAGMRAAIKCTLKNPTGYWTESDGVTLTPFR